MDEIRIKTVGSNGRNLAVAKGDVIGVCIGTFNYVDEYWLTFKDGAVIIKTTAARYARRVYPGEPLEDGLLVSHTSGVKVWIPLNRAERPVLKLFDKNGSVRFLPDTYAIARWRLLAATGRAVLWVLLAGSMLLTGCSMFEVDLPYSVPEAPVEPLATSIAFPNQRDRTRLYEYAEANSPGLATLRAAQKLALAGDQEGIKAIRDSLDTTSIGGVELPLKAIVIAVAMLWQWVAGGNEVQEEALQAQYEQAKLEVLHALNAKLNAIENCWETLDRNEGRLFEARADYSSTKLLVEKGLLAGADAHKELALARDRVERLEDEREEIKQRKRRLTNEALALLGMNPWDGK